jgi:hypothetical protein
MCSATARSSIRDRRRSSPGTKGASAPSSTPARQPRSERRRRAAPYPSLSPDRARIGGEG